MRGARAQFCLPGLATTCDTVLIVCRDESLRCADVQSTLLGTGAFSIVDIFDTASGAPTAADLAAYHAVLAFSSGGWGGYAALLGDRLAAYHDQGGGVVVAPFSNVVTDGLLGAYGASGNGYTLLNYGLGSFTFPGDTLGDVLEPDSPLMAGVASLAASLAYRSQAPVIVGSGVVVARWRGGGKEPLIVRGTRGNRALVELNLYPPSSNIGWWAWTGDGAALMRNALKYSRCMPNGPSTTSVAGATQRHRVGSGTMVAGCVGPGDVAWEVRVAHSASHSVYVCLWVCRCHIDLDIVDIGRIWHGLHQPILNAAYAYGMPRCRLGRR